MICLDDPVVYEFIRGPLASTAFMLFALGSAFQMARFRYLTKKAKWPATYADTHSVLTSARPVTFRIRLGYAFIRLRRTAFGRQPVLSAVSTVFHGCLLITPLFLMGHNILLDGSFGFSFFSFSEKSSDGLTLLLMACVLFFLMRRIFLAQVRVISTFYDYFILGLALAPFLTGYLAYHQVYHYPPVIVLHMLCGELMIVAVPYTKLMHAIYFFFMRYVLPGENSFTRGKRVWQA
jgi:nitrate reductase gamma subunit